MTIRYFYSRRYNRFLYITHPAPGEYIVGCPSCPDIHGKFIGEVFLHLVPVYTDLPLSEQASYHLQGVGVIDPITLPVFTN